MITIACGLGEIEDQIIGLVLGGGNFLQDDIALALHLVFIKGGRRENIGENIQRQFPVLLHHAGIVGGGFHAGGGVDFTADIFNFLGNGLGGAARRAFEGHVFEKMRHAIFVGQFIPGTRLDPYAQSHGFNVGHVVGDDSQPIGKLGNLNRHCLSRFSAFASPKSGS